MRGCALALASALSGCQAATGLSELHATSRPEMSETSCTSHAQCTDAGAGGGCLADQCVDDEIAAQWICKTPELKTAMVRYSFRVIDFTTREPPANVVVHACRTDDVGCSAPVDSDDEPSEAGHVELSLPAGFTGFFEISSDALPVLLYVTKPISRNILDRDVPVITLETVELTSQTIGFPYDPERGIVLLEAIDCAGAPSGGIRFELDGAEAERFYVVDQLPNTDADATVHDATHNTATGGFINVPAGRRSFSAYLGRDGVKLQSFDAQVRAGTITFVDMVF